MITIYNQYRKAFECFVLIILFIGISSCLMFSSLSFEDGKLLIASKVWNDFLAHIPLVRSFSFGSNFPPEYPLYAGEPIRYHFLFYYIASLLEVWGLRIDIALNLLSIIGFSALLFSIYFLGKHVSGNISAGLLSVLFFLCNASFSWIKLGQLYDLDMESLSLLWGNKNFWGMGPWDRGVVSSFWNLNVYMQQRHFAFGLALIFFTSYLILRVRGVFSFLFSVFCIVSLVFLHKPGVLCLLSFLALHFMLRSENRKRIFFIVGISGIIALFFSFLLGFGSMGSDKIILKYGFLGISQVWEDSFLPKNPFLKWTFYWLMNLGILPVLVIGGIFLFIKNYHVSSERVIPVLDILRSEKLIWLYSALMIFVLGNVFKFSTDMFNNHKLFNYSVIVCNVYAALFIVHLYKKNGKIFSLVSFALVLLMTLSGFLNLLPLKNDTFVSVSDYTNDQTAQWVLENTQKEDRFINITYETHPITIVGRKIYWGWVNFQYTLGYDIKERRELLKKISRGKLSKSELCNSIDVNKFAYLYLNPRDKIFLDVPVRHDYFEDVLEKADGSSHLAYSIYDLRKSCAIDI